MPLRAPHWVELYRVDMPQYDYEVGDKQNGCFAREGLGND